MTTQRTNARRAQKQHRPRRGRRQRGGRPRCVQVVVVVDGDRRWDSAAVPFQRRLGKSELLRQGWQRWWCSVAVASSDTPTTRWTRRSCGLVVPLGASFPRTLPPSDERTTLGGASRASVPTAALSTALPGTPPPRESSNQRPNTPRSTAPPPPRYKHSSLSTSPPPLGTSG